MSSMRSASSRTRYEVWARRAWPPSRKSLRRPGVAMTRCTPLRRSRSWGPLGAPPYAHVLRKPPERPNLSASSLICTASSRVGASTHIVGPAAQTCTPTAPKPRRRRAVHEAGQQEAARLAGPGFGDGDEVGAAQRDGPRLGLNGGGLRVARLADLLREGRRWRVGQKSPKGGFRTVRSMPGWPSPPHCLAVNTLKKKQAYHTHLGGLRGNIRAIRGGHGRMATR